MSRRHLSVLVIAVVITLGLTIPGCLAFPSFTPMMPNGDRVVRNGVAWPGVGHSNAAGGGSINAFGNDWDNAGHAWTVALCQMDSDNDGFTNGQELGDPECVWSIGSTPSRITGISHPGFSDSTPDLAPAPPTPAPVEPYPTGAPDAIWTSTIAGSGQDGTLDNVDPRQAQFSLPNAVAAHPNGTMLFVADVINSAIRTVDLTSGAESTGVSTLPLPPSSLSFPRGVLVSYDGTELFVSDTEGNRIRKVTGILTGTIAIETVAGSGIGGFDNNAAALQATFNAPGGLAQHPNGMFVYVADTGNCAVRSIVFVGPTSVTTVAGNGVCTYAENVDPTQASLNLPFTLALDSHGHTMYISDPGNNLIRRLKIETGALEVLAGNGNPGHTDSADGSQAEFFGPDGIGLSIDGKTLYVAEVTNNRIRAIDTVSGAVSTVAGNGTAGSYDSITNAAQSTFNAPNNIAVDPDGRRFFIVDTQSNKIRVLHIPPQGVATPVPPPPTTFQPDSDAPAVIPEVTTLAGSIWGFQDSQMPFQAQFAQPTDIAVHPTTGMVYVCDKFNAAVRAITISNGAVTDVATIAGSGGPFTDFGFPEGIGMNADGSLVYVADTAEHKLKTVNTVTKAVSTVAGSGAAGDVDHPTNALLGELNSPVAVAHCATTNMVYIAESAGHKIRAYVESTKALRTIAGSGAAGDADSTAPNEATFNSPYGLAVTSDGASLYVADQASHKIRKIDIGGSDAVTTVAGTGVVGTVDTPNMLQAEFDHPHGLALSSDNNQLFVSENWGEVIRVLEFSTGTAKTVAGSGDSGYADAADGLQAQFTGPSGIGLNPQGNRIYVADTFNNLVRQLYFTSDIVVPTPAPPTPIPTPVPPTPAPPITPQPTPAPPIITPTLEPGAVPSVGTVAGNLDYGSEDSADPLEATFSGPQGLALDAANHVLYVSERLSAADVSIRKITLGGSAGIGNVSTVPVTIDGPEGIALSGHDLYVVTGTYVYRVDVRTDSLSTFAGNGMAASTDNSDRLQASFESLTSVAIMPDGSSLLVCEYLSHVIRRVGISTDGVTTIAGDGTYGYRDSSDALKAKFWSPVGIAINPSGTVAFVTDTFNARIRGIDLTGSRGVWTVAGDGVSGFVDSVSPFQAQFDGMSGLLVSLDGSNLFVSTFGNRIRRVELSPTGEGGVVTTIAGNLLGGFDDNPNGLEAGFFHPKGMVMEPDGRTIFVADSLNNMIRSLHWSATSCGEYNNEISCTRHNNHSTYGLYGGDSCSFEFELVSDETLGCEEAGMEFITQPGECRKALDALNIETSSSLDPPLLPCVEGQDCVYGCHLGYNGFSRPSAAIQPDDSKKKSPCRGPDGPTCVCRKVVPHYCDMGLMCRWDGASCVLKPQPTPEPTPMPTDAPTSPPPTTSPAPTAAPTPAPPTTLSPHPRFTLTFSGDYSAVFASAFLLQQAITAIRTGVHLTLDIPTADIVDPVITEGSLIATFGVTDGLLTEAATLQKLVVAAADPQVAATNFAALKTLSGIDATIVDIRPEGGTPAPYSPVTPAPPTTSSQPVQSTAAPVTTPTATAPATTGAMTTSGMMTSDVTTAAPTTTVPSTTASPGTASQAPVTTTPTPNNNNNGGTDTPSAPSTPGEEEGGNAAMIVVYIVVVAVVLGVICVVVYYIRLKRKHEGDSKSGGGGRRMDAYRTEEGRHGGRDAGYDLPEGLDQFSDSEGDATELRERDTSPARRNANDRQMTAAKEREMLFARQQETAQRSAAGAPPSSRPSGAAKYAAPSPSSPDEPERAARPLSDDFESLNSRQQTANTLEYNDGPTSPGTAGGRRGTRAPSELSNSQGPGSPTVRQDSIGIDINETDNFSPLGSAREQDDLR